MSLSIINYIIDNNLMQKVICTVCVIIKCKLKEKGK